MTPAETCWRAVELLDRHDQQRPHPVAGPLRGLLTTVARMCDTRPGEPPAGLAAYVLDLAEVIVRLAAHHPDREEG